MFSDHTTPEEFKNATITAHVLDLRLRKTRSGKSLDYRDTLVFEKLSPFSKCFKSTRKRKAGVFKFLQFEERFRDGLVQARDQTRESGGNRA